MPTQLVGGAPSPLGVGAIRVEPLHKGRIWNESKPTDEPKGREPHPFGVLVVPGGADP